MYYPEPIRRNSAKPIGRRVWPGLRVCQRVPNFPIGGQKCWNPARKEEASGGKPLGRRRTSDVATQLKRLQRTPNGVYRRQPTRRKQIPADPTVLPWEGGEYTGRIATGARPADYLNMVVSARYVCPMGIWFISGVAFWFFSGGCIPGALRLGRSQNRTFIEMDSRF